MGDEGGSGKGDDKGGGDFFGDSGGGDGAYYGPGSDFYANPAFADAFAPAPMDYGSLAVQDAGTPVASSWADSIAPPPQDFSSLAMDTGNFDYLNTAAPAAPVQDFSTPAMDTGNFDYLNAAPPAADAGAGAYDPGLSLPYPASNGPDFGGGFVDSSANALVPPEIGGVSGYGQTDLGALPAATSGDTTVPPGGVTTAGSVPPDWTAALPGSQSYPGGTPEVPLDADIPAPGYNVPGQTPTYAASDFTFSGPAGASSTPDVAALNAAPIASPNAPLLTSTAGAGGGPSPAGGLQGAGGGAAANDLSQSKLKKEGDTDFLSNFGIKNPLGTALAAGALGYGLLKGNANSNAATTGTGAVPMANMAAIAAPLIAQGQQLTTSGANTVQQGVADLRDTAAAIPAATQPGRTIQQNAADSLAAQADAVTAAAAPGQAVQATAAQELLATASSLPASIEPAKAIIADSAATLTQLAASTTATAQALTAQGTDLTKYVGTGTLPPEMMAQVDQSIASAKAQLMSQYAARGMPTNPAKNSSLRLELEALDRQRLITINSMASQLATTGTNITNTGLTANQQAGGFTTNAGNLGGTYGNIVNQNAATTGNLTTAAAGVGSQMVQGANQTAATKGNLTNAAGTTGANLATGARADLALEGSLEQQAAGLGQGLVTSGLAASGLSATTYNQLSALDQAQADRTAKAIAAMAAALNGGTPTKTTTTTTAV